MNATPSPSRMTLDQFNSASAAEALESLKRIFHHGVIHDGGSTAGARSDVALPKSALTDGGWLDGNSLVSGRPFLTLAALKQHVAEACLAMPAHALAGAVAAIQAQGFSAAAFKDAQPDLFTEYTELLHDYQTKFGWPFLLATKNARGTPHSLESAISTLKRHLKLSPHLERKETLRQMQRITELRLHEQFDEAIDQGQRVWDWQEHLAQHSDEGFAEKGQLTVTYLTPAHQACARQIVSDMQACGCDDVFIDAVGNVVGRYLGDQPGQPMLMTGSHYDTVRNGGKYDGRLGIYVPLACIRTLSTAGRRLPYGIEVVAFSEEEGQRYKATFLASSALTGQFDPEWLEQNDAQGIRMKDLMIDAGLQPEQIPSIQREPSQYLGFIEVHIEQGPVLYEKALPLGVVTSINGGKRYLCQARGTASHAGTTPMDRRNDAACAVAELMLFAEKRAAQDGDSVATVGMLEVPSGSVNVIPGTCKFSLDMRAPTDPQRDALIADVLAEAQRIGERRGVSFSTEEIMQVDAAPSDPAWQQRWEQAVRQTGVPVFRLPSGAGHDAMKIHHILPQAMLFVRGENGGISHNPLESTTAHDMQLAVEATMNLLNNLACELRP